MPVRHLAFPAGCAMLLGAAALLSHAGPLSPPPGAPAPTYKTLAEVEPRTPIAALPFTITQPGSYYLTGDLTGVSGQPGITVDAPDVTIDLMGFTLRGVPGSLGGIHPGPGAVNTVIGNGRVAGWGGAGVSLGRARLRGVESSGNGGPGFFVGDGSVVAACNATGNGGNGFHVLHGSAVESCTASFNAGSGFATGDNCTLRACAAAMNGVNGITGAQGCVIADCSARSNVQDGIDAFALSRVERCAVSLNGRHGITGGNGAAVVGCSASQQASGAGIRLEGSGGLIAGCVVRANGDGVEIAAGQCRVEGNHATSNTRGYLVSGASNLVIRNTADANGTNYVISSGNTVGAIVASPTSGSISGSSGGAGVGTTDPWGNLSF